MHDRAAAPATAVAVVPAGGASAAGCDGKPLVGARSASGDDPGADRAAGGQAHPAPLDLGRSISAARTVVRGTCRRTRASRWRTTMNNVVAPLSKSDRIRVLNDNFRSTFVGGQVMLTQGVSELPLDTKARVLLAVQSFSNFTKDNDPHGKHDFGSVEIEGETYFFKVDYYALDMQYGSEDPADPNVTARVLTIMRADEY
jgi:hypothetical protein